MEVQQTQQTLKIYDLIINKNYFSHGGNILHQNEGSAMGTPSSTTLSEIFLQYIEDNFTVDIFLNNKILGYFLYVDDTLTAYDESITDISCLINQFNQIHQNLQYTMELEEKKKIYFLDLTVSRNNKPLESIIVRKPTYTNTIPYNSCHPA
jgi:hypothetical protein